MIATLEVESTLTERYQTTVPGPVRKVLKLGKRDRIQYKIISPGKVIITRVEKPQGNDPVLGKFLSFLAKDIERHPGHLKALDASFAKRLKSLTSGIKVDLNATLSAENEEDE